SFPACFVAATTVCCVCTTRSAGVGCAGRLGAATPAGRAGDGVLAASAACSSVFAACRAPYPNARPNRTLSIAPPVYRHPAPPRPNSAASPEHSLATHSKRSASLLIDNVSQREQGMRKLVWFIGGMAAAAAGFLVWSSTRVQPIVEPAYYLDDA